MRKRMPSMLLILALLLSLFAGCGGTGAPQEGGEGSTGGASASADSQGGNAAPGGDDRTLIIGTGTDMITTDPQALNNGNTTAILYNIYSRLLKQGNDASIELDLATDYYMVDDYTWEFKIRDDAYFHNGDKVTAEDLKFGIDRASKDDSLSEIIHWGGVEDTQVVDDYTLRIITYEPYPMMPSLVAKSGGEAMPKNYIEENGWDYFLQNPVGSGPYRLVSYAKDDRVVLEPFEDYYGEQNPDWDQVIIRIIPESSTRVGELIAGNVHAINNVMPTEWDRVNATDGISVVNGPSTRIYQLALKVDAGPTSDLRVRQAIDLAIDNQLIVDQILKGAGHVIQTRIPPGIFGHDPSLYGVNNYDPARARELLAEAGYADGFDLTIEASNGSYLMDGEIAQAITAMLTDVGINVNLILLEPSAFSNVYSSRTCQDAFLTCFGLGFFDASYGLVSNTRDTSVGVTNYDDDRYNELYITARANMNMEEREQQCFEMQQIAVRDKPYITMMQIDNTYGVSDSITLEPRIDDVWNLLTIRKR